MAALDNVNLAKNAEFQARVQFMMVKAAIAVFAEAPETAQHAGRLVYAQKIMAGTASVLQMALAVLTNATVASAGIAAPDNDIEFAVNSVYNCFLV